MPVNLKLPVAHPIDGVQLASVAAGIKKDGSTDLVLALLDDGSKVAGVFTQNHFAAAPVQIARDHLVKSAGSVRALLINSGNANAGTGEVGLKTAMGHCVAVSQSTQMAADQVLPFSTGVIGEQLPDDKIHSGIAQAVEALGDNWLDAARGIMTTDTVPKISSVRVMINGEAVTITGMVKGSGMIQPNMATMLSFIFTDASISTDDLNVSLKTSVAQSFNVVTVDSDTSTNDACILAATGKSVAVQRGAAGWDEFQQGLNALTLLLAQALVRDGEGATKFITVRVTGARTENDARTVAFAVANSPLVKTAVFASDANIGRFLMAIGKADISGIDQNTVKVSLGANAELSIFEDGIISAHYSEEQGAALFALEEITVCIDLGMGNVDTSVYTSDLSHEYVSINADYRS